MSAGEDAPDGTPRFDADGEALHALLGRLESTANAEPAKALAISGQALDGAVRAVDLHAQMQVHYLRGFAEHLLSLDQDALESMERALSMARSLGDRAWEARALSGLGAVHSGFDDNASAIDSLEHSLQIRRELGDQNGIAAALNNLGVTLEEMGLLPDRASELLREAHRIFTSLEHQHGLAATSLHLASLDARAWERADTRSERVRLSAGALRWARAAVGHARAVGDNPRLTAEALVQLARALIVTDDLPGAGRALVEAAALAPAAGTTHLRLGIAATRGRLSRRQGDLDAAATALESALEEVGEQLRPFERVDLLAELVEVHEERRDYRAALEAHRLLLSATLQQREERAEHRARSLTTAIDVERARLEAEVERFRSQQLEEANRLLAHEATHDSLTGLANRRRFDTALAARTFDPAAQVTCLVTDLDHFKEVNDEHSHAVGDDVLIRVAGILRICLRGADLIARIGGEEIAVLLADDGKDERTIAAVCERIRADIEAHNWEEIAPGLSVTTSLGAAVRRPGESGAALMARADAALYEAKVAGRNRVVVAG